MRIRESSRLVLLNDQNEILLLEHVNPVLIDGTTPPILRYWVTPGGGVEEAETWEDAALRELREETGISSVSLGPWVWFREGSVQFSEEILSRERYYLVRCERQEVSKQNQTENERRVYRNYRWWSCEELRQTSDVIFPAGLARIIAPLIDGRIPDEPIRLPE